MDERFGNIFDRGWSQMSESLDKNLPVKTNKITLLPGRKFYYSAALVLILVGSMLITVNNTTRLSNLLTNAKSINTKNVVSDIQVYAKKSNHKDPNIEQQKKQVEIGNLVTNNEIINNKLNQTIALSNRSINISTDLSHPYLQIPKITNESYEYQNEKLSYANNPTEKNNIELKNRDFKHNVISISVNSVNEDLSSLGGVDGSINYAYKMNKRLGFMTGIEHSMFSKNRMNIELENYTNALLALPEPVSENLKNENIDNPTSIEDRLYYVGIPLGVMYSFNKFTLSAGVKFSYLLNNIYDTEHINFLAENSLTEISNNEQYSPRIYNKFDYSLIFGFEFHIVKDFSVFSKLNLAYANIMNSYTYQQNDIGNLFMTSGLDNLYKERMDKNIYFGLGIKYDIKKK